MKKIIIGFISFIVIGSVCGQDKLSFESIRDSIIQNYPSVNAVNASVQAIEAAAAGAYSWMAPEVGVGLFETPYNIGMWKGTSSMPGMGMAMVSAEQMFPNKKAQHAQHDYLKSTAEIEKAKQSGLINELVAKARTAYYELIINTKKLKLIDDNKKLLEFMIKSAEIRYKNNLGNINSYYKLKASLAKLNTRELVLDAANKQQYAIIRHLMQKEDIGIAEVDTSFRWFDFTPYIVNQDQLKENSAFLMLDKTIQSNQLEQQAEKASLKPQFGLKFDHMIGWGHQPQMFSLMAMMKLPIAKWSSRETKAKLNALDYQMQSYRAQQQAYINQENSRIQVLTAELSGIKSQLKMTNEQIIPALEKNFKTLQISYEQNKAEIFELADAWQSLLDAQSEYLDELKRGMEIQSELLSAYQILEL